MDWRSLAALTVFVAAFVLLATGRLGRWTIPRGAVALAAGLATKFLLDVPWTSIDVQVLLLLAGLMSFAGLAEEAGFFAGVRRRLLRMEPWRALWMSTLLMAGASAVMLNDAAVVVLLPFLLPSLVARGLPAVAAASLLAVAANIGSLLTPMGNPQNAIVARAAGLGILDFVTVQGPVVAVGLGLLAAASRWAARSARRIESPAPPPAQPVGRPWLFLCLAALLAAVAAGFPFGFAAVGCAVLAYVVLRPLVGPAATRGAWRGLDANVLALFAGLYLLTAGLPHWLHVRPEPMLAHPVSASVAVAGLSNAVGNVPAVLMLLRLDEPWTIAQAPFVVAVSTLGGTLLLTGSAASLLAADQARRLGVPLGFAAYLRWAIPWTLPLLAAAAWWTWR